MALLLVEGDTLGEKHRNYNKLVNEDIKNRPTQEITAINFEESDMNNLYKIDIACHNRNVEYVLEAFKCEDMLYVSRVIKRSTWLITDQQYSYIINPEYMHNILYLSMTSEAFNKLILNVKLNLKDERRVEEFFNYYKQNDLQKALKWLPRCSIPFIENIIRKHGKDIPTKLMIRLHRKSITFLEILIRNTTESYYKSAHIQPAKFLLKTNIDKFLDIIEEVDFSYNTIHFGPKLTKRVMKNNFHRIKDNFEKFAYNFDLPTFAKFLNQDEIKDFILTYLKNKKTRYCFNSQNIKHFLNRLPVEERFDFVNKYFIEKSFEDEIILEEETCDDVVNHCSPAKKGNLSSRNIYGWYVYAPFIKAFEDLKQLIRNESNPAERVGILRVMLTCAGSDTKNILTLIKYYREHHINEPFMFKLQFVNVLLSKTETHKYDKDAWGYLNDLFKSMDVYNQSEKNVQSCVRAIIIHNIINGENIPEIIEKKFEFENLNRKNKFDTEQSNKIFSYLYKYLISKIKDELITEKDLDDTADIILKVLNLLKHWNKELTDYPFIHQKIKEIIIVRKENSWKRDLSDIYDIKKSWRKLFFAESLLLSFTEDSCINALKHDSKLLEVYKGEITKLCLNGNLLFKRFLKKIRIYWNQSLAKSFETTFLEYIDNRSSHVVTLIKGLCILLAQKELLEFVQKYVPIEAKIDWSQPDKLELNLSKYIAQSMHLARPHPPLAVALLYAKGDYLQYVVPSLNAILCNISGTVFCEYVSQFLKTPVSLQKHCIRAAFTKLKYSELKNIFSNVWESSKNSTVRTEIFCQTYQKLCKEREESVILEIWELLSIFIDKLTNDENKKIYLTLSKVEKVPLSVRAAFWMKSYSFLKNLPEKTNCTKLINNLHSQMDDIREFLDVNYMANIYLESFDVKFTTKEYEYSYQLALFLLSSKTETSQSERCDRILVPLLEKAIAFWDKQHGNVFFARNNLQDIFNYMSDNFENIVLNRRMLFPIEIYTVAISKLEKNLPIRDNYFLLRYINLSFAYIKIIHDLKSNTSELGVCSDTESNVDLEQVDRWKNLNTAAAPIFARLCLECLIGDVAEHFPSTFIIFASVLDAIFDGFINDPINKLRILKVFIDRKDFIQGPLLVMKLMPRYLHEDSEKALRSEMFNELISHPSDEVLMHYWYLRKDNYN